jgi:hypothetical protein
MKTFRVFRTIKLYEATIIDVESEEQALELAREENYNLDWQEEDRVIQDSDCEELEIQEGIEKDRVI